MGKHTPGPWIHSETERGVGGVAHFIRAGDDDENGAICQVFGACREPTVLLANLRLIAAAPELLEAVKTFLQTVEALDKVIKPHLGDSVIQGSVFDLRTVRANLQSLIAKAEGKFEKE